MKWQHDNEGPYGDQFVTRENLSTQHILKFVQTLKSVINLALCLITT